MPLSDVEKKSMNELNNALQKVSRDDGPDVTAKKKAFKKADKQFTDYINVLLKAGHSEEDIYDAFDI